MIVTYFQRIKTGLLGGIFYALGQMIGIIVSFLLYLVIYAHTDTYYYVLAHTELIKPELLTTINEFLRLTRTYLTSSSYQSNIILCTGFFILGVLLTGKSSSYERKDYWRIFLLSLIINAFLFLVSRFFSFGTPQAEIELIVPIMLLPLVMSYWTVMRHLAPLKHESCK